MEYNLVWNHTRDFKIERARSASSIWNQKYDFGPKLHDTKFNYCFIIPILKSHIFFPNIILIYLVFKKTEPETLLDNLCKW